MVKAFILGFAILAGPEPPSAPASQFLTVKLPRGVSLSVPRNWELLSENQRVTLDTSVMALLDLSNLPQEPSELPFAANYYDESRATAGVINVRYYPTMDLGQDFVAALGPTEIAEIDREVRKTLEASVAASGMQITSWLGTKREKLNGISVLVTSYRRVRKGATSEFLVRLYRVLATTKSFTLTVSCRQNQPLLEPICERIGRSVRLSGS